jgi:hypothetical protein
MFRGDQESLTISTTIHTNYYLKQFVFTQQNANVGSLCRRFLVSAYVYDTV